MHIILFYINKPCAKTNLECKQGAREKELIIYEIDELPKEHFCIEKLYSERNLEESIDVI